MLPFGAFCNTFDLHLATICHKNLLLNGRFTQVLLSIWNSYIPQIKLLKKKIAMDAFRWDNWILIDVVELFFAILSRKQFTGSYVTDVYPYGYTMFALVMEHK